MLPETAKPVEYQYPAASAAPLRLAIIGEAPGADEVKKGKPFVGRSGQLLDKNLEMAGIDRAQCLVANVFRIQPPKNKVAHFFMSKKAAKESNEALAEEWGKFGSVFCRKIFESELLNLKKTLAALKPQVIITLGNTSLWALAGMGGILSLRGETQSCRMFAGAVVVPTYHPSYILRGNWKDEPLFLSDLVKARELSAENLRKIA
jgi:DNA polymerase